MAKVTILRGLPGSGKTTYARMLAWKPDSFIVSRDEVRRLILDGQANVNDWFHRTNTVERRSTELAINNIMETIVREKISKGLNVVIDQTNLKRRFVMGWVKLANELGATPEVKTMDSDVQECIRRDLLREPIYQVGEDLIREMNARAYWGDNWSIPEAEATTKRTVCDESLKAAIICDLDGTLCHIVPGPDGTVRSPYNESRAGEDEVDPAVLLVVNRMIDFGATILFTTGRRESARTETLKWIKAHVPLLGSDYELLMRPDGDARPDHKVKEEIYFRDIDAKYNVRFVLDDRASVVNMWRKIGLKCLQVQEGDF